MVDVGGKPVTQRFARARGSVEMSEVTLQKIRNQSFSKGNVLEVARLAGIMASKKTSDLIPLCHPLPIAAVNIDFEFSSTTEIVIWSEIKVSAQTGAEMEALTAASIAALTIYDMCKSVDRGMVIKEVRLEEKSGGKSGHFVRSEPEKSD